MKEMVTRKVEHMVTITTLIMMIIGLSYSIKFTMESNPIYTNYSFLQFFAENHGPAWMISWNNLLGAVTVIAFVVVFGTPARILSRKFSQLIKRA